MSLECFKWHLAAPDSLAVHVIGYQRRRMYERFLAEASVSLSDTILDVGVTGDRSYASSNYLEQWYPHKNAITAVGWKTARGFKTSQWACGLSVRADFTCRSRIAPSISFMPPPFSSTSAHSNNKSRS